MANYAPDRTGLAQYYTTRRVTADVAVHRAIARLARRRDLSPAKALTALAEAVQADGISKRTLQRHWHPDITTLRETLRQRYQPPATQRHTRTFAILAATGPLQEPPEEVPSTRLPEHPTTLPVEAPQLMVRRTACIVHGHDAPNALQLATLLSTRWHVEPIIFGTEADSRRTHIERLEHGAQGAAAAFFLFTSDDFTDGPATTDMQVRSHILFDVGWFSARLTCQRVYVLCKKGTELPSDLEGITRMEFSDSVDEATLDIARALRQAGLL